MNAFALPHLGHHFLALLGSEFGILRFTVAPAERDCGFIFHRSIQGSSQMLPMISQ
jgi:hypothetical protein